MRPAAEDQTLLALLKVDETAEWREVRRAFREAVRANHPDLHPGDAGAERRLKTLNAAWETVNTPSKWRAYVRSAGAGAGPALGARGRSGRPRHPGGSVATPAVGRLRIHRQRRGGEGLLNWKLELDGEVAVSIENGGVTVLEAEPGRHRLRVFYASYSSLPLEIALNRGEELVLGCRQLESLRVSLFSPKRSLVLEILNSRSFA